LKILINPLSENIEKISEIDGGTDISLRNSLDTILNNYKSRCYKSGISAVNSIYTYLFFKHFQKLHRLEIQLFI
jgi:hypothetical protein